MTRGLDVRDTPAPGCLEDAQLRLELCRVAAERVERVADAIGLVAPVVSLRNVLEAGKRRQRRG
jgi:hypothetical protein